MGASILEDRNQRIRESTSLKGRLVNDQGIKQLTMANNLVYDVVTDLMEDRLKHLITMKRCVKVWPGHFRSSIRTDPPDNNVLALFFDSKEELWFGT
jgi:ligand-binding sensor domain-containing protein